MNWKYEYGYQCRSIPWCSWLVKQLPQCVKEGQTIRNLNKLRWSRFISEVHRSTTVWQAGHQRDPVHVIRRRRGKNCMTRLIFAGRKKRIVSSGCTVHYSQLCGCIEVRIVYPGRWCVYFPHHYVRKVYGPS